MSEVDGVGVASGHVATMRMFVTSEAREGKTRMASSVAAPVDLEAGLSLRLVQDRPNLNQD